MRELGQLVGHPDIIPYGYLTYLVLIRGQEDRMKSMPNVYTL